MEENLEKIRDIQKETWNKFSPGWKKWDHLTMDFLKPMGDKIISLIKPKDKEVILDIAAGTGEPGLTIASMIPNGKVVITDLADGMLEVAKENALKKNLKNVETKTCDVCELPFDDNTFDAISCRMGFMFFPDMLLAAKEMVRVLKPGGRIAASVWDGPEKNFWVAAAMGTIKKYVDIPVPPPGAPGMFRCSAKGCMSDIFKQAGLKNISETEVESKLNAGTTDVYWTMTTEVAAPVVGGLSKADDATKEKIKKEVIDLILQKYPEGKVNIDAYSTVIYGEK